MKIIHQVINLAAVLVGPLLAFDWLSWGAGSDMAAWLTSGFGFVQLVISWFKNGGVKDMFVLA